MRLPETFLEELRARTPLPALIGRRVKLARNGRQWKGCCPFHQEKTPSFYVYDDHYHCFGCAAHGDAIAFVMQSQGADFFEAVQTLAGEAGLELPKATPDAVQAERKRLDLFQVLAAASAVYHAALFQPGGAEALAYLRRRGLSDETIKKFALGWAGEGRGELLRRLEPAGATADLLLEAGLLRPGDNGAIRGELFFNRVMFPIRDKRGRVISFGGRTLGDGQPKYMNGPETPVFQKRMTLYGLDLAREAARAGAPVVAVEGYMDVIALHQAGFGGAVAPLGTALTETQLEQLWALSPAPVLCFDGDAAGGRAAARTADLALPKLTPVQTIRIATLPAGEDPDTLVKKSGAAAFGAVLESARPVSQALFDLMREPGTGASPEQRAGFRTRLVAAASRFGDRSLAAEVRRDLLDRFYAMTRRNGAPPPPRRAPRPLPAGGAADAERLRTLMAILLRQPALLPHVEEPLSMLDLPAPARRIVEALQCCTDQSENLDSDRLLAHLTSLRLTDDVAWALGSEPYPLPACAAVDADPKQAEAAWWQIYGLMRRSFLEAEIDAARRDFTQSFSETAQQRLVTLCAELQFWRGGGYAPEAGPEDY